MALKVNERNLVSAQIGMHIQASNRFPEKHEHQLFKTCVHEGIGVYASYPMRTHPKENQGFFTDLQKNEENESNNQRKACYGTKATY